MQSVTRTYVSQNILKSIASVFSPVWFTNKRDYSNDDTLYVCIITNSLPGKETLTHNKTDQSNLTKIEVHDNGMKRP